MGNCVAGKYQEYIRKTIYQGLTFPNIQGVHNKNVDNMFIFPLKGQFEGPKRRKLDLLARNKKEIDQCY